MKERKINDERINQIRDSMEFRYGKGTSPASSHNVDTTSKEYELTIADEAKRLFSRRVNTVIEKTPKYIVPFVQAEIDKINRLFDNSLTDEECFDYCKIFNIYNPNFPNIRQHLKKRGKF